VFNAGSFKGCPSTPLSARFSTPLKETYCGSIGVEYMYMNDIAEKRWMQDRLEPIRSKPTYTADRRSACSSA
jgi:2-oxoglutarate dehydrogenase E1 component